MYSIYIVDDEQPIIQHLLTAIPWLEHGFEVIGSNTDPLAAIPEIIDIKPDVVFTDLKMPDMTGLELCARLKELGVGAEFIMLSAFDAYDAVREFFSMGGIDYILKPLDHKNAAQVLEKASRKLVQNQHRTPSVQFSPSQSKAFDELIQYVTDNFLKKHTLKELGERFGLNQTYICDLFSKQYNSTLIIFVTDLRMKEAARLIAENQHTIKEVSVLCGYRDYHHFARTFKQYFGKPPSKFQGGG
jgi:YesN/AraC family two-component response regulator